MKVKGIVLLFLPVLVFFACKKWEDPKGPGDPRIDERTYCNDPEAVNYNWNFPGKPDNTTCFYPTDIFKGTYLFTDSIYSSDNVFDSARSVGSFTLRLVPIDKYRFTVSGFCGLADSLKFTAERATYRANADSTINVSDTTFDYGQYFCRVQDTISGFLFRNRNDSTRLMIEFVVRSDTGLNFHRGTAIKQ
jgi:hypothetical protein